MPKTTWGSDLDEEAIESAESRTVYAGPLPPAGVYRFKLRWLKKAKSKQDNPMVRFFGLLDGTWKDDHSKFDGAPLFVDTAVMAQTAWRIKALVQGLGVTAKQFMTATVTDDEDPPNILKIGTKKIVQDMVVYVHVKQENDDKGNPRLTIVSGGFVPAPEEDGYVSTTAEPDGGEDGEDGGKKAKKDKKSKKTKGGEEPPF
jgi:hypothetical protein